MSERNFLPLKNSLAYFLIAANFIFLLLPENITAEDTAIGRLAVVQGVVTIKKMGIENAIIVRAGDNIFIGDILKTEKGGRAQIVFKDDIFINMSEDTALQANQYIFEPENSRRKALIKVLKGKIRFIVHSQRSSDSLFRVETGAAQITTNTGDFVVTAFLDETEVAVLDKSVNVKNKSNLIVETVSLRLNQKTSVKGKNPPSKPVIITNVQRRSYTKDVQHF